MCSRTFKITLEITYLDFDSKSAKIIEDEIQLHKQCPVHAVKYTNNDFHNV